MGMCEVGVVGMGSFQRGAVATNTAVRPDVGSEGALTFVFAQKSAQESAASRGRDANAPR